VDTLSIVFFRSCIAAIFIGLVCIAIRQAGALRLRDPRATLLVGLFQGAMIGLIMAALRMTSVSNALFLLYTAPIFSVLLARVFLKERIAATTWAGIGVALLGVLCIVDPRTISFDSAHALGNLLALGAGLSLAAMTVAAKPLSRRVSGHYIVFWQYLVIAVLTLPFIRVASPTTLLANWWQIGGLGVVCTGIAYLWYMRGVRHVPAQHVLIVASLEPLVGTAMAALILGESLSHLALVGAALIVLGAYGVARTRLATDQPAGPSLGQSPPATVATEATPRVRLRAAPQH
jgi:drug/metabolite transporter (DMT)-like permease